MRGTFILAQKLPPEALSLKPGASGSLECKHSSLSIWANVKPTPPLCRPAGWIAQWRKIGTLSVLNRNARA